MAKWLGDEQKVDAPSGWLQDAMIGAFLMATLANGCNLTGIPNYVQEILIGAIIVGAVALDGWRAKARSAS